MTASEPWTPKLAVFFSTGLLLSLPPFHMSLPNNIKTTITENKIKLPSISLLLASQLFPLSPFPTVFFMHMFFFITALLRYNSHAIKFTLSKLYSSVFSSIFTELCNAHHYLILDHFIIPERNPIFIISYSPFSAPLDPTSH